MHPLLAFVAFFKVFFGLPLPEKLVPKQLPPPPPEPVKEKPPEKIENASHFLQEDAGEEIGGRIAEWLAA